MSSFGTNNHGAVHVASFQGPTKVTPVADDKVILADSEDNGSIKEATINSINNAVNIVIGNKVANYAALPSPASTYDGQLWYVVSSTGFAWGQRKGWYESVSGAWVRASNQSFQVQDNENVIVDDGDNTKKMDFELSGITTGNTRTVIMADSDVNLADIALNNTHRSSDGSDHTGVSLTDGSRSFTGTVGGITPVVGTDLATKDYVDGNRGSVDVDDETIEWATTTGGDELRVKDNGITSTQLDSATNTKLGYIDQDVTNGSSPTFDGANFTGIPDGALDETYALLAGRAGGQTLIGGTASGEDLTLQSTSDATKGSILFGTSEYDEVNNRLGIGKTSPGYKLDVEDSANTTVAKIGDSRPFYFTGSSNDNVTYMGFNTYNNGSWRYGPASSTNIAAYMGIHHGLDRFYFSVATGGNADAVLSGVKQVFTVKDSEGIIFNSGQASIPLHVKGDVDASLFYTDVVNDEVGVGTTSPDEKFHVVGNIKHTGYINFTEIASPTNPAADNGRLYIKDDTGTTKLYFKDSSGTETDLLDTGADVKAAIDSGATADYVGAAAGDGFLRVDSTFDYTDGGNFVTLGLDATLKSNYDTAYTHANGSTGADHTYIDQDVTSGSTPTFTGTNFTGIDHGTGLTGLADDDHTQYGLLIGRSGGSTYYGSPDTAEGMILYANSTDATAGRIDLNTGSIVLNEGGVDIDFRVEGSTDTNLFNTDAANDAIGIGVVADSTHILTIKGDLELQEDGGAVSEFAFYNKVASIGDGTWFGRIEFGGLDGGVNQRAVQMIAYAGEAWSAGNQGAAIKFRTTENGTTTATDNFIIADDGGIFAPNMKSGLNQGDAGAAAGELWYDTNDSDTVKMGV